MITERLKYPLTGKRLKLPLVILLMLSLKQRIGNQFEILPWDLVTVKW